MLSDKTHGLEAHMKNWNKLYSKDFSVLLKKALKVVS